MPVGHLKDLKQFKKTGAQGRPFLFQAGQELTDQGAGLLFQIK